MLLCRDATYVTLAILPIRNVNLTSQPIALIVLILRSELFLADHTSFRTLQASLARYAFNIRGSR